MLKNRDKVWKQGFTSMHKITTYMYTSLAHADKHKTCLFIHKQDWKLKEASLEAKLKSINFPNDSLACTSWQIQLDTCMPKNGHPMKGICN